MKNWKIFSKKNYAERAANFDGKKFHNENDFSVIRLEEFSVTWFGHSSLLLQMHGMNILIDPAFSEVISPVSWIGRKRFSHPPVSVAELPEIDILILSHDHYDHLDYDVIRNNFSVRRKVCNFFCKNLLLDLF